MVPVEIEANRTFLMLEDDVVYIEARPSKFLGWSKLH
jgi:hypothetical protein